MPITSEYLFEKDLKFSNQANLKDPLSRQLLRETEYCKAYFGKEYTDYSLVLIDQEIKCPIGVVIAAKMNASLSSNFGGVLPIWLNNEQPSKKLVSAAIEAIEGLAKTLKITDIRFTEKPPQNTLSELGNQLLARNYAPHLNLRAVVDLEESEQQIKSKIRKSYKSLINWSRNNFVISTFSINKPISPEGWRSFINLHRVAAGRVTRSKASWMIQRNQVNEGLAELLVAHDDHDRLVSAAFCRDIDDTTYYSVAASDRSMFDKPLGHALIQEAILTAKARGQRYFDLGEAFSSSDEIKLSQIAMFKRGFCRYPTMQITWGSV